MDSQEVSQDPVPTPSENEVLDQHTKRLAQWEKDWGCFRTKVNADIDTAISLCGGHRPLHPDTTLAEEMVAWQYYADLHSVKAAVEAFGPKPSQENHPDAQAHDARALERRRTFMRQETTKNQTPKLRDIPPGTVRDDLSVRLSGPEPEPLPERTTFAGNAPPEAARMAPTSSVEPIAPPVYETLNFGGDEPEPPGADELDAMSAWLGDEEVEPPTPRAPLMDNVPPADAEDSLWAALTLENQDEVPNPRQNALHVMVAEQAIEYPVVSVPDPPVEAPNDELFSSEQPPRLQFSHEPRPTVIERPPPVDEDIPPPETFYRTRSRSSLELRLLLGAALIGFGAFLVSQRVRREPTRLVHPPDAPAVCLLPQALDQLPSAEQMRYIDCQLPHEARPSFHCRAPSPNSETAQIELCTRAWRTCAPPFGTAISPEMQASCLAGVTPPLPLRP